MAQLQNWLELLVIFNQPGDSYGMNKQVFRNFPILFMIIPSLTENLQGVRKEIYVDNSDRCSLASLDVCKLLKLACAQLKDYKITNSSSEM